jgi:hypothetical protein
MPSWHGQQTLYISTDGHFGRLIINGRKKIFSYLKTQKVRNKRLITYNNKPYLLFKLQVEVILRGGGNQHWSLGTPTFRGPQLLSTKKKKKKKLCKPIIPNTLKKTMTKPNSVQKTLLQSIYQGVHKYSKNLEATYKFQALQKWHEASSLLKAHYTKFSDGGDLATGICAPLVHDTPLY